MSWDVLFVPLPAGIGSIDEVPADYQAPPLGNRGRILVMLQERIPAIDFSDPSWGMLEGETFAIEFSLGHDEVAQSLMLYVRGGDEALGVIRDVSEALGCQAIDCGEGELLDLTSPQAAESFSKWRAFRDPRDREAIGSSLV